MVFEGVSFNEAKVKTMTEKAFVSEIAPVFWEDRSKEDREKLAKQAYALINPPKKKEEK